jgi:hypothetical protein
MHLRSVNVKYSLSWSSNNKSPWENLCPRFGMAGQKIVHLRSLVPERICICYCYSYVLGRPCALDLVWQGKKVHLRSLVPERICICYCICYVLGRPCALDLVWQGKK